MSAVVEFIHVSKRYRLWSRQGGGLKSMLLTPRLAREVIRESYHLVLDDINFSIQDGESVAIIGRNGAGKSTLLSLLAGVLRPSSGKVITRGRVAGMLELGAGFHPELTGRENIRLNATLLGLRQKEIDRAMPDIIAYADIGRFIEEPVRIYSSGMLARLGFAVISQISPDILLIDEVLAVSDQAFRQKCLATLRQFQQRGVTLLMVSHNPSDISAFCNQVLWFENHRLYASGTPQELLPRYQHALMDPTGNSKAKE
ncbi:TPA: ABC transporter ATP-binding protein [Enterobacter roggenkampii]|nr:ABC transporter ATP-binding protein [Enterobacter roggenkampii]